MSEPPNPPPAPAAAPAAAATVINSNIPFPEPLKLTGNVRENVENFRDSFEIYLVASGLELKEERVKVATFKAALGLEARKVFNLWPLRAEEQDTVAACLESLSQYMVPQRDVKLARYEFFQCQQQSYSDTGEQESMSHFINRARELIKDCNFGALEDEMLRDKIITGILDVNLKKRFIGEQNLTSAMVINQCRTEEATKAEMERQHLLQAGPSTQTINKVGTVKKRSKNCAFCGKAYHQKLTDCLARGKVCNYCKQRNHYEAVCRKKLEDQGEQRSSTKSSGRRTKQIHSVNEKQGDQEDSSNEESVTTVQYLYSIKHSEGSMLKRKITLFNRKKQPLEVSCILDSAASCNVIEKKLHEAIHGLRNVRALADDVLIYGCGETVEEAMQDHNENLEAFLQRMHEEGVKLNGEKVKLCQENVKFFGHILTSEGVKADPDKVNSILEMDQPRDVPSLLRFLGMITYLTNYLPSLASVAEPLRRLTNKDEPWVWTREQEEAYKQLKRMVTTAPVLRYFDVQKDVIIQCDSSSTGLGAVLLQEGHPVVYASKTLSATERKFAQIEKETLAILFACRKFEMYIIGTPVTVQTDHQPLLRIFQKPLVEAPLRIQRMLLALQRYNITLRFTPGKEVVIADMLSRAAIADGDDTSKEIYDVYALEYIPISDDRIQQIKMESKQDPEVQTIIQFVVDGWPSRSEVPESLQVYWPFREEFSTHNGLVFRNDRILIPRSLRKEILERLHLSHSGIEATSKLARDTVFWPGINDQIRQTVQQCDICKKFSPNQQPQPMQSHQIPSYPFQKLSMDICEIELGGRKTVYLITVDHYSDYFDIDELTSLNTATIIKTCKKNFARFGRPQIVSTDSGVQFLSEEFQRFALDWGFKHTVSAPYHQQANGKAESAVKIAKLLLKKAYESKKDFWDLLLQWRNTPNKCDSSPAQRLLNRRTRFGVPMAEEKYFPKVEEGVEEKIKRNRQEAKLYYDRKAKQLPSLEIGQPVFVKLRPDDKEWKKATLIEPVTDRSSIVAVGDREYRRDNTLIKPVHPDVMVQGSPRRIKEELSQNQQILPTTSPEGLTPPRRVVYNPTTSPFAEGSTRPRRAVPIPAATSSVEGPARPRRAVQAPKKFDDFEMY